MIKVQCCPLKRKRAKIHKEWATVPCPYAPFGVACMKHYGHGSPHLIEIEAAYVEKFQFDLKDSTARGLMKDIQIVDSALYDAIIAAESRHPEDMPRLRALMQTPGVFDE